MSRKLKRLPKPFPEIVDTALASAIMGLNPKGRRVRALCERGELRATLAGRRTWVIKPKDFLAYLERADVRRTEEQRVKRPWPIEELRRALKDA